MATMIVATTAVWVAIFALMWLTRRWDEQDNQR